MTDGQCSRQGFEAASAVVHPFISQPCNVIWSTYSGSILLCLLWLEVDEVTLLYFKLMVIQLVVGCSFARASCCVLCISKSSTRRRLTLNCARNVIISLEEEEEPNKERTHKLRKLNFTSIIISPIHRNQLSTSLSYNISSALSIGSPGGLSLVLHN